MNQQENPEQKTLAVEVEDLTVEESAQQEVKGGTKGIQTVYTGSITLTTTTTIG
jgi:hypothetical protein